MAVIRDVMPAFDLLQPSSVADAQKLLQQHGSDAWVLAGGLDSFDWLKDRIKKPKVVVDLSGVDELRGIRQASDGGIEIGSMTTLTEVVKSPAVKERFKPAGKIHCGAHRWNPDITEIARAIPRRNIHASAEGNSKMCEVAADAAPLVERFPGCSCGTRVFVAE